MRRTVVSCLVAALVLAACASVNPDGLKPGASLSEITQQMGEPRATYPLANGGKRLEFRGSGPLTFMLDVDASGKLVQSVQVLNETNFRNIVAGMTREQVLATLGKPDNVAPGGRQGGEVWSYNFRNTQCQWFQVAIGADGRTSGGGSTNTLQACMSAAA
jgi:SmpA / OmlA family